MPNLDFNSLVADNRRSSDDFVNATKWAKQFGKDFAYFWKSPEIRAFARVLDKKLKRDGSAELAPSKGLGKGLSYDRPGRGKKGDTFIHQEPLGNPVASAQGGIRAAIERFDAAKIANKFTLFTNKVV